MCRKRLLSDGVQIYPQDDEIRAKADSRGTGRVAENSISQPQGVAGGIVTQFHDCLLLNRIPLRTFVFTNF